MTQDAYAIIPMGVVKQCGCSALKVYASLAYRARGKGRCFPTQKTIQEDTGLGDRATRTGLAELVQKGVIAIERTGRASSYILCAAQDQSLRNAGSESAFSADQSLRSVPIRSCELIRSESAFSADQSLRFDPIEGIVKSKKKEEEKRGREPLVEILSRLKELWVERGGKDPGGTRAQDAIAAIYELSESYAHAAMVVSWVGEDPYWCGAIRGLKDASKPIRYSRYLSSAKEAYGPTGALIDTETPEEHRARERRIAEKGDTDLENAPLPWELPTWQR